MQVNVFVSGVRPDEETAALLVLPSGSSASVPDHLRGLDWRYFATTEADDHLIGLTRAGVELAIAADGYVLTLTDRFWIVQVNVFVGQMACWAG